MEQNIANKVCDEKKALEEKWAKFESLTADEQHNWYSLYNVISCRLPFAVPPSKKLISPSH